MKKKKWIYLCSAVLLAAAFAGCAKYEAIPQMPEYEPLSKEYSSSAPIYLYPLEENEWVNSLIRKTFYQYGYRNLLGELPDRLVDPAQARVVIPLEFSQKIVPQKDGNCMVTRIIVSVRNPGTVKGGKVVRSARSRTFQARSQLNQLVLKSPDAEKDIRTMEARRVLDNLFTIEGFRKSLQ